MRSPRTASGLLLAAAMLALGAAPADAAPPAAVDEYTEMIPGADGDKPSRHLDNQGSGSDSPALPPKVARRLERLGPDGAAVARIAEATGPRIDREGRSKNDSSDAADVDGDAGGDSPIRALVADVIGGSDDGLGPMLPVILGLSLLAALAFALLRRRRT